MLVLILNKIRGILAAMTLISLRYVLARDIFGQWVEITYQ